MAKAKRNERLVYMTHYLMQRPHQLVKFQAFQEDLQAAKSSLSEDIEILKNLFAQYKLGKIQTMTGAGGGLIYLPHTNQAQKAAYIDQMVDRLETGRRILPGNYILFNDIMSDPDLLKQSAKLIAEAYQEKDLDAILTIETKGIGLATLVADCLGLPCLVVRRGGADTIGSTISVNYVSGSYHTLMRMELSRDSLSAGSRVLIIDDFLRNGGTAEGLVSLVEEFDCQPVGVCVLVSNTSPQQVFPYDFKSLMEVDMAFDDSKGAYRIVAQPGKLFNCHGNVLEKSEGKLYNGDEEE